VRLTSFFFKKDLSLHFSLGKYAWRRIYQIFKYTPNIPSRTTVARDVMRIFLEEKAKMIFLKKQCVSLSTYTWSSNQNLNYMVLTTH